MRITNLLVGGWLALLPAMAHPTTTPNSDLALQGHTLDKRLITTSGQVRVISISVGMRIVDQVVQAFENSGYNMASGWAGQIEYDWQMYSQVMRIKDTLKDVDGMWASGQLNGLYCTTINAVFTFGSVGTANKFRAWATNNFAKFKRDDSPSGVEIYTMGIDEPPHPSYFGNYSDEVEDNGKNNKADEAIPKLQRRAVGYGYCVRQWHFPYSSYTTNVCKDRTFPRSFQRSCLRI